jgi:flagellar biosynthesis/type III secretory pathway protein FliH
MSKAAHELALKILALVDEYPSEPFSLERRWAEENITNWIAQHTGETEDELDMSFQVGYEEGFSAGKEEAEDDLNAHIHELEEELEDLRSDLEDALDRVEQSFAEGYETASKGDTSIETLKFN